MHAGSLACWRPSCDPTAAAGANEGGSYDGLQSAENEDVLRSYPAANRWFSSAAKMKCGSQAKCYLGTMYEAGRGVPQDFSVAAEWYLKAVEAAIANFVSVWPC